MWLLEGRKRWRLFEAPGAARGVAGTQQPGDVLFVPAGWQHDVENAEFTVAVSHNFVAADNAPRSQRIAAANLRSGPRRICGTFDWV